MFISDHLQNKMLCNIIENNFWVTSKSSMNCDLRFCMKIGKKNMYQFQYKLNRSSSICWPYIKNKLKNYSQNQIQFLLSSQGWIIGDLNEGRRLITEHEDIFPNSTINLVWATQRYEKSSFDS